MLQQVFFILTRTATLCTSGTYQDFAQHILFVKSTLGVQTTNFKHATVMFEHRHNVADILQQRGVCVRAEPRSIQGGVPMPEPGESPLTLWFAVQVPHVKCISTDL